MKPLFHGSNGRGRASETSQGTSGLSARRKEKKKNKEKEVKIQERLAVE